jgi:hypothetical protein
MKGWGWVMGEVCIIPRAYVRGEIWREISIFERGR